jgi:hypothetical protein
MIKPGLDLEAWAAKHRVRFVRKDQSRLMRAIAWVLGSWFLLRAWTTIGRTVYYPAPEPPPRRGLFLGALYAGDLAARRTVFSPGDNEHSGWDGTWSRAARHRSVLEHEYHHIRQFERLWHLHSVLYLLGVPLPFLLAWYRWWAERGPYLHQMRYYGRDVERTVQTLWRVYGWCWPRRWMRRWFEKELRR